MDNDVRLSTDSLGRLQGCGRHILAFVEQGALAFFSLPLELLDFWALPFALNA
jgi:hypothetical protein